MSETATMIFMKFRRQIDSIKRIHIYKFHKKTANKTRSLSQTVPYFQSMPSQYITVNEATGLNDY